MEIPNTDRQTRGKLLACSFLRLALGFRDCEPEVIEGLAAAGHVQLFGKGEQLVRRGDPFDMLCLVLEGAVEVGLLYEDGHRHLLAYLYPGNLAGLTSLLDGMGHPNDLTSRASDTKVLLIPGVRFRELHDRHASLVRAVELQLTFRMRLLQDRVAGDGAMALDVRLARLLHLMSALSDPRRAQPASAPMKISQYELGDFLGVSRQRANFAVQQLKRVGLLDQHYSVITILDPGRLMQYAGL